MEKDILNELEAFLLCIVNGFSKLSHAISSSCQETQQVVDQRRFHIQSVELIENYVFDCEDLVGKP